jgi:hypothetical protein
MIKRMSEMGESYSMHWRMTEHNINSGCWMLRGGGGGGGFKLMKLPI